MRGAQILGAMDTRILFVHIAPNILPPIAFVAILDVARMMIFEAIFGFIGIGIQPPTPTFGTIIADGTKYLLNAWWITSVPGVGVAFEFESGLELEPESGFEPVPELGSEGVATWKLPALTVVDPAALVAVTRQA